jgi:hypothetical protein
MDSAEIAARLAAKYRGAVGRVKLPDGCAAELTEGELEAVRLFAADAARARAHRGRGGRNRGRNHRSLTILPIA